MQNSSSTIQTDGPFARAICHLEEHDLTEELAEVRRLLVERLQYREDAVLARDELARVRDEMARVRDEMAAMARMAREQRRVARQCIQSWRSLALIQQSREELGKVEEALASHPWLRAA